MSKIYAATSLTGGAFGSLDSIDGAELSDQDAAIAFTDNRAYIYTLDETSGAPENSPNIIRPDVNGGLKRWILIAYGAANVSVDVSNFDGVFDSSITNVQTALDTIDDLFDLNDFNVIAGQVNLDDSVVQSITSQSGSATPELNNFNLIGDSYRINTSSDGTATISINLENLNLDLFQGGALTLTRTHDIINASLLIPGTITLPDPATKDIIRIIKSTAGHSTTIDAAVGDILYGGTITLSGQGQIVELISDGVNSWYPLSTVSTDAEIGYIRDFIGKDGIGVESPNYTSTLIIDSTANLETAISQLDAAVGSSGLSAEKVGLLSLSNGDSTAAVTFTTPYSSTNYVISGATLENLIDALPSQYAHTITQKLASGFILTFSGPMDSDNYVLNWNTKFIS